MAEDKLEFPKEPEDRKPSPATIRQIALRLQRWADDLTDTEFQKDDGVSAG